MSPDDLRWTPDVVMRSADNEKTNLCLETFSICLETLYQEMSGDIDKIITFMGNDPLPA